MTALRALSCLAILVALLAGCGGGGGGGGGSASGGSGGGGGGPAPSPSPTSTVRVTTWLAGQSFPVDLAFAPDGRLFFNELQTGLVRVVSAGGVLAATPFATESVETNGERGLLGLALDPAFASNGFVYVFFSDASGVQRLVRYTASGGTGTARTVLLDGLPSNVIHNGGRLAFGPDGRLYLTLGESGNPANAQDPNVMPGGILRLNPDGTVPADNPFGAGLASYAKGLRNSFGIAFHPTAGTLYASENGPNCDDELNRIVAGGNYGWRPGVACGDTDPNFLAPIRRFNPTIAPTGVAFYQGALFPELRNWLLLTDFNTGRLQAFQVDDADGGRVLASRVLISGGFGALLDVTPGPDGAIYVAAQGAILRVTP